MNRTALLIVLLAACGGGKPDPPRGGASIHVLFDERHGLQGGERVRMHEFDIGMVETIDLAQSRVRATIDLAPEALDNLTVATTFTVEEEDDELFLEAHVLDPDAEKLQEGATVEGSDSHVELAARQASEAAGSLVDEVVSSEWWGKASDFVGDVRRELEAIDWTEEEKELRKEWEETVEGMDDAVGHGVEELKKGVDELVKELERAGRSDEARELRERFRKLLDELKPDEPG